MGTRPSGGPARHAPARALLACVLAGCLASLLGCTSSDPLQDDARAVRTSAEQAHWQPARAASVPGDYHAENIEGAAAPSMLALYYHFDSDGTYAAAALVASEPPTFQTLDGHWTLKGRTLSLDDGSPPATLEESEGRLRLTTEEGRVVILRDERH